VILSKNSLKILFLYSVAFVNLLFGRAGQGIEIFGYRIAEFFILLLFIFSVTSLLNLKRNTIQQKLFKSLFGLFIFLSLYYGISFPETFRYGSFVVSFYVFFLIKDTSPNEKQTLVFNIIVLSSIFLFIHYILVGNFIFSNIFRNISDKPWDFLKASQIVVILIYFIFFIFKTRINLPVKIFFSILSGLIGAFLVLSSRGATLAFVLGLIILSINFKNKKHILLLILTLIGSTLFFIFTLDLTENIEESLSEYNISVNEENTNLSNIYGTKYSCNNKLENFDFATNDANVNWRIHITKEVFKCSIENFYKFTFGYGFSELIIPMNNPMMQGSDGLNINPHNIILTVFYRMGFVGLVLFLTLYLKLIKGVKYSSVGICFITASLFGVVFESVTQLVFWILVYLELNYYKSN
tara:strand:- start:617 stop:1846 length:1230 start_codon:yes stop_codon:yes gene_type:complete